MKVLLQNKELWQRFSEHQTEMLITTSGRRMCPVISVAFEDLKPLQFYTVMVDFVLADNFTYSFDQNSNSWIPKRSVSVLGEGPKFYIHPDTPMTGVSLMQNVLNFKRLKLTSRPDTAEKSSQVVLLNAMRRYIPRIHVIESSSGIYFDYKLRKEFLFPETTFMAVTSYRNRKITQLKIDANPFAKAYRSDGLHGQAKKRRRAESMAVYEDWKTPENGPPSNSSSTEDCFINGAKPDVMDYSSASEQVDEPPSEKGFAPNERQVNEIHRASPCQTGPSEDVSYAHYVTQGEARDQQSLPIVSQVAQNQSTNKHESHLACQESVEWIWGFDEQISVRNASENQSEGSDKQADSPATNDSKNATDTNEADSKPTVNRRKKYLPRKVPQMTRSAPSPKTSSVFEDNEDAKETEPADRPNVDQADLPSSQSSDTTISMRGDSNKETSPSPSLDIPESPASPCFEPPEKRPVTSKCSPPQQHIEDHAKAILAKFLPPVRLTSEKGSEGTTASSLNALMQMCSEAEGRLNKERFSRKQGTVMREKFEGLPSRMESSTDVSAEARTYSPEQSDGSVSSQSGDSLSERSVQDMTTSSHWRLPQESVSSVSVSLTSEVEQRTRTSPTSTFSSSSGYVTLSDIPATSPVVSSKENIDNNNNHSSSSNGMHKSPTTANLYQTGSTAITMANSHAEDPPLPVIVNTFSGYHVVNGLNNGQFGENKQPGYRPIVPAPNQPVNVSFDEPASDASYVSSCCDNNTSYPIIIDSFSINEDFRTAVGHRSFKYKILQEVAQQARQSNPHFATSQTSPPPQVNRAYFASPNSYQTSNTGFIALDNTVHTQPFCLEKFYSFYTAEHQAHAARFRHQNRYYKATRTNFSRLSLEPICSLVYPLYSSSACSSTS